MARPCVPAAARAAAAARDGTIAAARRGLKRRGAACGGSVAPSCRTPLILACDKKQPDAVKALLMRGADATMVRDAPRGTIAPPGGG